MSEIKMVSLKNIQHNPFRNTRVNPFDLEKVKNLADAVGETGFWIGICGRELPDSTVQLADGHYKVEAARHRGLTEIPVALEKFSDEDMLRYLVRNVKELPSMVEAVRAVVNAYAAGHIHLETPSDRATLAVLRYAPSFVMAVVPQSGKNYPYSALSLARYLGCLPEGGKRVSDTLQAAIAVLEAEELGLGKLQGDNVRDIIAHSKLLKEKLDKKRKQRAQVAAIKADQDTLRKKVEALLVEQETLHKLLLSVKVGGESL